MRRRRSEYQCIFYYKKGRSMKNFFKSIGAVVAGFLTVAILSVVTDVILEKMGVFPPVTQSGEYANWMLFFALVYRTVYTVLGGYITAALAPSRQMRHVIILGTIGLVFATLGTIANWDKTGPSSNWYPILLVILSLPSVWVGGKVKTRQ
jgi:hypothetical protein